MIGHKLGEFSPTRIFRGHSTRVKEEESRAAAPSSGAAPTAATPAAAPATPAK